MLKRLLSALLLTFSLCFLAFSSYADSEDTFSFCDTYTEIDKITENLVDDISDGTITIDSIYTLETDEITSLVYDGIIDDYGEYADNVLEQYPDFQHGQWIINTTDSNNASNVSISGISMCLDDTTYYGNEGETSDDYEITEELDELYSNNEINNGETCVCKRTAPGTESAWVFIDQGYLEDWNGNCYNSCATTCAMHFAGQSFLEDERLQYVPTLTAGMCDDDSEPVTVSVQLYQNNDPNDNTVNTTILATTKSAMPLKDTNNNDLIAPTREGYVFLGYYDARTGGTQYYTSNMTSAKTWNKSTDSILYAQWKQVKFAITTTDNTNSFAFKLSASGTFVIDWGDGNIETITRNDLTATTYTHSYSNKGSYTIYFDGDATGYNTNTTTATISFYVNSAQSKIKFLSGSLGSIFGTLQNPSTGQSQPRFYQTFYGATNMTGTIPANMFSGISGAPTASMFNSTFYNCSSLTGSIPENLFANISGAPTESLFNSTFYGCSGLTGSIPENLFATISGTPAASLFYSTFYGCSGLTGSIPENLFATISGTPTQMLFFGTFSGCSGLTGSIPEKLFSKISGTPTRYLFAGTFANCSGLTGSIPENLFKNISGTPELYVFQGTFTKCSGLTGSIPANLFSGISGPAKSGIFGSTFSGCTGLTGTIPETLFANMTNDQNSTSVFSETFKDCTGITDISENLFSKIKGTAGMATFQSTFEGCTGIKTIPEKLFSGITGIGTQSFYTTFKGCTGLTGYIPAHLFSNITSVQSNTQPMGSIFTNTNLVTSCPSGTIQYITGFEKYFSGKISCQETQISTKTNITLYQDKNSNIVNANISATYAQPMPSVDTDNTVLVIPSNDNDDIFTGYYDINGVQYYDQNMNSVSNWDQNTTIASLYAGWIANKTFVITTVASSEKFSFSISAAGEFTVDWGDGNIDTITKTDDITTKYYSHTYASTGKHIIIINGAATGYSTSTSVSAISFSTYAPEI